MIHELLCALSGHAGNILVEYDDRMQVQSGLPFLHSSEEQALSRLCQLATHYKKISDFIRKHSFHMTSDDENLPKEELHGLYIVSLCRGLDIVLDDYRQELLELEKASLADAYFPVSQVLQTLQQYELLFPALTSFLQQIESHKAHGCYILEIIHSRSVSGLPIIRQTFDRLLSVCRGSFFKQLCSWMLHGRLIDPYQEFFIQETSIKDAENPDNEDSLQDDKSVCSDVHSKKICTIRADLLPSYIGYPIAKNILFIGESLQMFKMKKSKAEIKKLEGAIKKEEEKFAKEIFKLSREEVFNDASFRDTVDSIRGFVAEQLWLLVVVEADLFGQLKLLKDFFLFGRGDLYQAFIDVAHPFLKTVPTAATEHELNTMYQTAIRNVGIENDTHLHKFHLTCKLDADTSSQNNLFSGTVLSCLGLTYKVVWPLHMFFTPAVLEKYERVFRFLLRVHYVHLELQECWLIQMQSKEFGLGRQNEAKWQLRTHLAFLIDNLQYYLQVDVIESLHKILIDKIEPIHDFEAAKLIHDKFLTDLLDLSLFRKLTNHLLDDLLSTCLSFCNLIKTTTPGELNPSQRKLLASIRRDVRNQTGMLFSMLLRSQTHSSQQNIAQLMLRLDFNRFVTNADGRLGV